MEVQTVNNHLNNALISPLSATNPQTNNTSASSSPPPSIQQQQPSSTTASMSATVHLQKAVIQMNDSLTHLSRSNSPASSNSEIEKELQDLDLNSSMNSGSISLGAELNCKSNGSLSGASSSSTQGLIGIAGNGGCVGADNGHVGGGGGADTAPSSLKTTTTNGSSGSGGNNALATAAITAASIKKRISSSRTPTRKARRIKFYRNGDRFYPGITIPVSNERYRSFESLFEDLTRLLEENVKIPGAVRTIYTMCGKKISTLEELEDGQSYVCSCNNENFKKVEYNTTSQPLTNLSISNKTSNRISKYYRPSSPLKNGSTNSNNIGNGGAAANATTGGPNTNGSPILGKMSERDSVVHPRIVTLIRNGTRPRKLMRLLLNKRNSPSFDHVLTAITQKVKLDTGYVRKVFTLSGSPVTNLADFFGAEDVFFAYGTERVNNPEDFRLENDEQKALQAIRKNLRTAGTLCKGPKPKMPVKSKKTYDTSALDEEKLLLNESGIDAQELPAVIRERYILGQIIGDGNFAIVLKCKDRQSGYTYALKIIDKSKCKGKEHYIDDEVRVMKKLSHPHIISLIMDVDQQANMYLVLEYVGGGDLFDAITRVTRFSEDQSRVMIKHLAAAMAYLHSMSIVHRDIKPENLLVELDESGNVIVLKLADFGLACEVTEPLYAVCGTPTYVAPEILMETGYGLKIDVWAAGIILYILLCGFPPFVSPDNQQDPLFDAIISGIYEFPDPYWSGIGNGVRDLIANMLQSDPDVRFTSEDILDHYWTMGNDDIINEYSS
ncbi:serine/threonine-protein kinase GA29083 [Stomoxys calcitrans]|uniref:serine/threonine-protein kinase GA29083 n=1 Tax=Stomoxys calcitrans TaxID=35570 RepID=UPI0027E2A31F|nr:serine/threonine-protein kinase GA29083 [Stomoxys calcitrans]XP_059220385.1 serine/threonine-protein kinase GA29083 [Stomoxys calcitrans]XP_059220386.1 serine/threonine-protein kinase GA29083 [Stomoxys calcitrans]XP_059220387.1 serine/threonine-protein kinase GA29083 [Stomoxys calcitrans]